MPESQLDEDAASLQATAKRKTTYPRDHPIENPKPQKRTKADIQQAAKTKKEAEQAKKAAAVAEKKKKLLDAEEMRKLSAQRIAAIEDAVQHSQKKLQSHSERPDLKTMKTYKEQIRRQKDVDMDLELITNQDDVDDEDDIYTDPPEFPPESTVDTDSDGVRLGLAEDEGDERDKPYNASEEENKSDSDNSGNSEKYRDLKKQREKKKKEKGLLRAEIQAHRQVAPTVYAHPDPQLLDKEKRELGKKNTKSSGKIAQVGLHGNWKQRVQVSSRLQPPSNTRSAPTAATSTAQPPENLRRDTGYENDQVPNLNRPNPVSDGDDPDNQALGGEIGVDEDDELLTAVRQTSEAVKRNHKGGTKGMGIKLKVADVSAVKREASARRPAKPRYKNGHLPFQNAARDLLTWRDAVLPAIIDWAGTLDEPFAINSHPDLQDIVEDNWKEEFPAIPADDAVQAVAGSAIRNWRSAIGKHALLRLTKIFAAEPFKNSRNQRKEYVENELKDLSYIYRDPLTKSGAYRSSALMEVYAAHQQVISKTDTFYGYGAGALSLCAAAHERALKLWRSGNAPTKDTKKSFVRKPWAIRTAAHFKVVNKLSKRVWAEIHEASLLAMGSVDVDATADDSDIEDHPEDVVQLSSEDEAASA